MTFMPPLFNHRYLFEVAGHDALLDWPSRRAGIAASHRLMHPMDGNSRLSPHVLSTREDHLGDAATTNRLIGEIIQV